MADRVVFGVVDGQVYGRAPLHIILATRLRVRRVELGFSRELLARYSGVAPATIKSFERTGRISLVSFIRLVAAVGRAEDLGKVLMRRQRPDSPAVLGRRLRARRRGHAGTAEARRPR